MKTNNVQLSSWKVYLLNKVINWIVGENVFQKVQDLVLQMLDVNLTGEEKRKIVKEQIKNMYKNVSNFLINLAIEAAVTIIKAKMNKINYGK